MWTAPKVGEVGEVCEGEEGEVGEGEVGEGEVGEGEVGEGEEGEVGKEGEVCEGEEGEVGEVPEEEASRDDQHGEDLPGLEVLVEPSPEVVVDGGDEQVDLEELGGQADGQEGREERCQEYLEMKN